ncbi:MAG: glycosyltransferase [Proteocatella sp.]
MKISVIMSVYNGEKYLKESIQSVLNQTYRNFEFLIIDDASSDKTEEIIKKFAKKDNRIKYYKNDTNVGLTKNLNKLISYSSGDLIARMDADDIAISNRFLSQIKVFEERNDIEFIFSNAEIIDNDSKFVCNSWMPYDCKDVLSLMPQFNYIIHPSIMIKKVIFEKVGYYNEKFVKGQDKELWLRCIQNDIKFYFINENLIRYRVNPDSVRSKINDNYYYKLSRYCINNNNKKKSLKYMKNLKIHEKINILTRILIPYFVYRKLVYVKNNYYEHIRFTGGNQ